MCVAAKDARRYVALFKRLLESSLHDTTLSEDERASLHELEARLPVQMTLALRGRCEELVEEAVSAAKINGVGSTVARASGWLFARLFRGWRSKDVAGGGTKVAEVAGVELAVSEAELRGLCFANTDDASGGVEPLADLLGEGASDPRFRVSLSVGEFVVESSDRLALTGPLVPGVGGMSRGCLFSMHFRGVEVEVGGKAGDYGGAFGVPLYAQLGVDGVSIADYVAVESVHPQVLGLGMACKGVSSRALFVRFEDRPAESNGTYMV